jgi:hypothetical protein
VRDLGVMALLIMEESGGGGHKSDVRFSHSYILYCIIDSRNSPSLGSEYWRGRGDF